jgi:hypothetical protein
VTPRDLQRIAARVQRALQLQLGIELHLRAQGARQSHDFLQQPISRSAAKSVFWRLYCGYSASAIDTGRGTHRL